MDAAEDKVEDEEEIIYPASPAAPQLASVKIAPDKPN